GKKSYKRWFEKLQEEGSFFGEIKICVEEEDIKHFEVSVSSNVFAGLYMAIIRDITEKLEMERKVVESENKFRKIFDNALNGMMIWKDGVEENSPIIIHKINKTAKNIFHIQNKRDLQKEIERIKLSEHNNINLLQAIKLIAHQKEKQFEVELRNGERKAIEMYSKRDILPGFHLTVFNDITQRIQMEEQLKKSDTLNVVGELAAGIAHEIRNPLTSLKGFIQLLKGNIDGYDTYFNIIMSELERI